MSISGALVGGDAWVPGPPLLRPACPPSAGCSWGAWFDPHSDSHLLHATVHEGAAAWPGGPIHHHTLSELGLLILAHVVWAVQGVQQPCGGGGQESRRCKSTWGCSREPWPKVQLCHRPAVPGPVFPTAEQFLRVWGWSVGNGGQTPLQALPANCRSWCLGKNAFLRYLVKDMGLRKCPGRPPPA